MELQMDKRIHRHLVFLGFLFISTLNTLGQTLHQEIQRIYDFEPHKLSAAQQKAKGKLLDGFWKNVKDNKEKFLPELRKELQDTTNSTFFSYDGGHLLLSLSNSKEDNELALTVMLRANLEDIDGTDYVYTMNSFAQKGLNTTEAGIKIILANKFWGYVPQHALMLDKFHSLLFVLMPINSDLYLGKTLTALKQSTDTSTITNVLQFLDYTCNCVADSTILEYSLNKSLPDTIRKSASLIVKNNTSISRRDSPKRYKRLASKRAEILRRVTDEALYELDELTNQLKGYYACR
jgi:hypothetical protein